MAISLNNLRTNFQKSVKKARIFLTDVDYEIPSREWITGKFYQLYRNWLRQHNRDTWKEYSDCDNFAFLFMAFAALCHAKTMDVRKTLGQEVHQGISVGVLFYCIDGDQNKGHAINIIYTKNGVEFLEPQSGQWMKLTQKERDSAWCVVC